MVKKILLVFFVVATILTIGINTAGCRLLPLLVFVVATSSTTIISSVVGVIVTFASSPSS